MNYVRPASGVPAPVLVGSAAAPWGGDQTPGIGVATIDGALLTVSAPYLGTAGAFGGYGRFMPEASGVFAIGSLMDGQAWGRGWVSTFDRNYHTFPGDMDRYRAASYINPKAAMPSGRHMIHEKMAAALGHRRNRTTGELATPSNVLENPQRIALIKWAKQDPTNRKGVIRGVDQLIGRVADQLKRLSPEERRAFVARLKEIATREFARTEENPYPREVALLTNLLRFGEEDPAVVAQVARDMMGQNEPVGKEGERTDRQVRELVQMFARGFGESGARAMLRQVSGLAERVAFDLGVAPMSSIGSVESALAAKGYTREQITPLLAAAQKQIAVGKLSQAKALEIFRLARSPIEENEEGYLPKEHANRLAFGLLLELHDIKSEDRNDPTRLAERLWKHVPLYQGKREKWDDFPYIAKEFDRFWKVIEDDKKFAALEQQKLRPPEEE